MMIMAELMQANRQDFPLKQIDLTITLIVYCYLDSYQGDFLQQNWFIDQLMKVQLVSRDCLPVQATSTDHYPNQVNSLYP